MLEIKAAHRGDIELLEELYRGVGYPVDLEYFPLNFDRQDAGERQIYMAFIDEDVCGFCIYNRKPRYSFFAHSEIPEIQDLAVAPQHREQGIGGQLIDFCENVAREEGFSQMGIGVGITKSFGAAQRLYIRKGYVPDGYGAVYDREYVQEGQFQALDSNLSLMLVKSL